MLERCCIRAAIVFLRLFGAVASSVAVFFLTATSFLPVAHAADGLPPQLEMPWSCEHSYRVSQAHDTGSHLGKGTWAWDFNIPEGTVVTAPADGVIRMVRDDSTRHGCGPEFAWDANYVIVDFENGTEALFLHMKAGSARVTVGQTVQRGDALAEVGNSGWVCGTHLHFQIQETCDSWWCQSIPADFNNVGDPDRGATLASNNCPAPESTTETVVYKQDQFKNVENLDYGKGGVPTPQTYERDTKSSNSKLHVTCSQSGGLEQLPGFIVLLGATIGWNRCRKYTKRRRG